MAGNQWKWDKRRDRCAVLVAEDKLTNEEIAAAIGVARQTVDYWKTRQEFKERVQSHIEAFREAVLNKGIADVVKRVSALDDRWNRMKQVIEERAVSPQMQNVAGGKTGLLVHQVKAVGKGEDFQLIDLYVVDDGLLSEMRATEKQAAIEVGQWDEKSTVKTEGSVAVKVIKGVSMDDL